MLALPAAHRFAMANSVRLRDLDGENYVERLNCEFDDYFQANHGEWPIHLNVRYQSTREDWIQAMICAGLGFAILPETFPLLPGIARTHLVEPEVCRTISIATLRDRENSPVARAFVQIVRAHDWC